MLYHHLFNVFVNLVQFSISSENDTAFHKTIVLIKNLNLYNFKDQIRCILFWMRNNVATYILNVRIHHLTTRVMIVSTFKDHGRSDHSDDNWCESGDTRQSRWIRGGDRAVTRGAERWSPVTAAPRADRCYRSSAHFTTIDSKQ